MEVQSCPRKRSRAETSAGTSVRRSGRPTAVRSSSPIVASQPTCCCPSTSIGACITGTGPSACCSRCQRSQILSSSPDGKESASRESRTSPELYLLDTIVVSELRKIPAGRADPAVHHWSDSPDPELLHITLGFVDCRNRPRAQPD